MSGPAPQPALVLTAAVIGHRPERISDASKVTATLGAILQLIQTTLARAGAEAPYAPDEARLRLTSSLAEGADRLGATAALAIGASLEVIMPFPPGEYEQDFPQAASREEFRTLAARADSILVLDGQPGSRDKAYEAAGVVLLENCDLLIAVWDGEPGRGRGGTRDLLDEAARRDIPIITVTPDGKTVSLRQGSPATAGRTRLDDLAVAPFDALADTVSRLAGAGMDEKFAAGWLALSRPPRRPFVYAAYPILLRLLGAGANRAARADPPRAAPAPPKDPPTAMHRAFSWWDTAAIEAAQAFRSAVIVNFALAAFAVALAVFSLLAGDAKWIFVVGEVATILLLLANSWHAGRRRWQERWLESREIAELLRVSLMLRAAGIGRGPRETGELTWSAWYVAAMARSAPMPSTDLTDAGAASRSIVLEIGAQAAWNEATALRMRKAGHRLERVGEVLFVVVLAASIGWLAMHVARPEAAHDLKYLLTAITAGFPAIAASTYGIRLILDLEGIAERARRMAAALRAILADFDDTPATSATLQDLARRSADVMLGDLAAWRLIAEGRRLTLPG